MEFLGIAGFGLFCVAVLPLNITPGQDMAYIVGRSITHASQAGLALALGISAV